MDEAPAVVDVADVETDALGDAEAGDEEKVNEQQVVLVGEDGAGSVDLLDGQRFRFRFGRFGGAGDADAAATNSSSGPSGWRQSASRDRAAELRRGLVDVYGSTKAIDELAQEISVHCGRVPNEDSLLGDSDLLDLLNRDQEELTPETAAAHFEQVWLVDPRDEAKSLDEPHQAGGRVDFETLTPCERVAALCRDCSGIVLVDRGGSRVGQGSRRDGTRLVWLCRRCQLLQAPLEIRDPYQVLIELLVQAC